MSPRLAVIAGGLLLAAGLAFAQPPKDAGKKDDSGKDAPPVRLRGQLPANYGKLSLTDEQKQRIYGMQAEYEAKIEKLEAEIKKLKNERNKKIESVLTAAQKERLKEILAEKDK